MWVISYKTPFYLGNPSFEMSILDIVLTSCYAPILEKSSWPDLKITFGWIYRADVIADTIVAHDVRADSRLVVHPMDEDALACESTVHVVIYKLLGVVIGIHVSDGFIPAATVGSIDSGTRVMNLYPRASLTTVNSCSPEYKGRSCLLKSNEASERWYQQDEIGSMLSTSIIRKLVATADGLP
ncbi:hypothetical protein K449DRAFT_464355 [Hypoxylon sp. EC38]|nr:hypothetical protein K449DRAFT_464355 [Hypoxylon sp. EC38]